MLRINKILLMLALSLVLVIVSSSFALGYLLTWCDWDGEENEFGTCYYEPELPGKCSFCGGEWDGCYTDEGDSGCEITEYDCCNGYCSDNHCCPIGEEWNSDQNQCIIPPPPRPCAIENEKASDYDGTCCTKGTWNNNYDLYKCASGYCQQCCNDGQCSGATPDCVDGECGVRVIPPCTWDDNPAADCDTPNQQICISGNTWDADDSKSTTTYCSKCSIDGDNHCGDKVCNCGETVSSCRADCCVDGDKDGWCKNGVNGASNEDCNDHSVFISPDDPEICYGGVDEDCNGDADCDDSVCIDQGYCIFCTADSDCPGNACFVNTSIKCTNNKCEYGTEICTTGDGICCFPVCDYPAEPGNEPPDYNPDYDCNPCPEPIPGANNNEHYLPVNTASVGSLSVYVDNSDNVHYLGRSSNQFGINMANALSTRAGNCVEPVFSRGYVVIDTSCIPADADIRGDVYFEFKIDDSRFPQGAKLRNASVWVIDPSKYDITKDEINNDNWIIPSTYDNNPSFQVQLDIGEGEYHTGYESCYTTWTAPCSNHDGNEWAGKLNRVLVPKQYINFGGYTAFILRWGQAGANSGKNWKTDKRYAEGLDNCNWNWEGNSCGSAGNCACRYRSNGPVCTGGKDPCAKVQYLSVHPDHNTTAPLALLEGASNCVGCMQGGYPAKSDKHFCFDDGRMMGPIEVTSSSPVLNISFCAPDCTLECGQDDGCGTPCPITNRSTGYTNPCDTSDICYDTYGAPLGDPLRWNASINNCILATDTACGTETGAQCLPPDIHDNDCDGDTNCSDSDCAAQPECSGLVNICRDVYKTEAAPVGDRWNIAWNADPLDCDWCLSSNYCVYQNTCYTTTGLLGTDVLLAGGFDKKTLCNVSNNKWGDIDGAQNACILAGFNWTVAGEPNVGEYGALNDGGSPAAGGTECCGDDIDEHLRLTNILGVDHIACCDNATDCVDDTDTCRAGGVENCTNNIDDDCDSFIDGADWDCPEGAGNETASIYRLCDDGANNDRNAQPGENETDADDFKCSDFCSGINASSGKILMFGEAPFLGGDRNFFGTPYGHNFTDWEPFMGAPIEEYCCGDDPGEFYKNTTMFLAGCNASAQAYPCHYHACCNETTNCIDANGNCQLGTEETLELCTDGLDNDCDGLIDVADTNCSGTVWGFVYDKNTVPLPDAIVKGSPLGFGPIYESMDTTDVFGRYNISNAFIGSYNFIGRKEGFDDNVTNLTIVSATSQRVDFILRNGSCHADCTDYYDNCNIDCEGLDFGAGEDCSFITDLCDGKPKDFKIRYFNITTGLYQEYMCCEGPERSYPRIPATVTGQAKDLYDFVLKVQGAGGEIEIMHILVWLPNDGS